MITSTHPPAANPHSRLRPGRYGIALAIAAVLVAALIASSVMNYVFLDSIPARTSLYGLLAVALIALGTYILARTFERDRATRRRHLIRAGVLIGLGVLLWLGYEFQTTGLLLTTPSKSAFITGLAVVLVPLFNYMPQFLNWRVRSRIYRWYGELALMERDVATRTGTLPVQKWLHDLDRIQHAVEEIKTPTKFASEAYTLREHIGLVRSTVLERANASAPTAPRAVCIRESIETGRFQAVQIYENGCRRNWPAA